MNKLASAYRKNAYWTILVADPKADRTQANEKAIPQAWMVFVVFTDMKII
jgi:hypothetical protein